MRKQIFSLMAVMLFGLFLTSCGNGGGGGDNNNALNAAIQGTWDLGTVTTNPGNFVTGFRITFTSNDLTGTSGTFNLTLNGQTISGTYTLTGGTSSGNITLTLSAAFNGSTSIIMASVNVTSDTITFNADINDNKEISATYSFNLSKQS